MSASKRPSTSSLRRFVSSRPYVPIGELRRRFALDEPEDMILMARNGTVAYIGLPEREAVKVADLWQRDEIGVELSVDVRAPVVVGLFPMRVMAFDNGNGTAGAADHPAEDDAETADA